MYAANMTGSTCRGESVSTLNTSAPQEVGGRDNAAYEVEDRDIDAIYAWVEECGDWERCKVFKKQFQEPGRRYTDGYPDLNTSVGKEVREQNR